MFRHLCLFVAVILTLIPATSVFARTPGCKLSPKFNYTVYKLNNPKKLVRYNWWHFVEMSDNEQFAIDYWQEPIEFFNNKHGDCDDFAIWNWYVLKYHEYKVQLLLVRTLSDKLHMIVKAEKDDKIRYIDTYNVYKKLPRGWEIERTLNAPLEYQKDPLEKEYDRGYILLKEGESISISIK